MRSTRWPATSMIIESGVVIFLGLLLLGLKLPRKISLRLLGRPLILDLSISVLAYAMHYGTFSGIMAAAVAGLMCSGFTSCARYAFGYIKDKQYHKGRIWQLRLTDDELR